MKYFGVKIDVALESQEDWSKMNSYLLMIPLLRPSTCEMSGALSLLDVQLKVQEQQTEQLQAPQNPSEM